MCPACAGLLVWSGFDLPVRAAGDMAFRYAADVHDRFPSPRATALSSAEATYAGVIIAARAMGAAGVDLTRAGLASVLDTTPIDVGLTDGALAWEPGLRDANRSLRLYEVDTTEALGMRPLGGWQSAP